MFGLAFLCVFTAALAGTGFCMVKGGWSPRSPRTALVLMMAVMFFATAFSVTAAFAAEGGEGQPAGPAADAVSAMGLGLIGAALSTGLACVGAGIGVAFVGSAALGVVGEKPALFGKTLIYMGLAEGIAIYGIVISLFILGRM